MGCNKILKWVEKTMGKYVELPSLSKELPVCVYVESNFCFGGQRMFTKKKNKKTRTRCKNSRINVFFFKKKGDTDVVTVSTVALLIAAVNEAKANQAAALITFERRIVIAKLSKS